MLNDTNIIRIAAFFPLVFAVLAMVQGILLGIKLKPGMVCKSSMHCSKCELLFALKVGTFTLSLAYFLAKTNWLIKFNGSGMTALDELAWIALESFFMGFLAWLCRRGRLCLGIHCESETRNGLLESKEKEKCLTSKKHMTLSINGKAAQDLRRTMMIQEEQQNSGSHSGS